jgi:DNA-binding NtrC family response regulator
LSLRWNSSISDRFLGVANLSPSLRRGTSRLCTSSTKPLCSTPPAKWISTTRARSSRESNSSASILETLKATGGSTSPAAEVLGISAWAIQYRLHDYHAVPGSTIPGCNGGHHLPHAFATR